MKNAIGWILLSLLLACPSLARTVTVAPGADLQAEFNALNSGDVLQLRAGTYQFGTGLSLNGLQNVTIQGDGGRAILVLNNSAEDVLTIANCSNVTLRNLSARHQLLDMGNLCQGVVVSVRNSAQVSVLNCELNGCGAAGVSADSSQDVVVSGCFLHSNSFAAVLLNNAEMTVHGCTIQGNGTSVSSVGNSSLTMLGNTIKMNDTPSASLTPFARSVIGR